MRIKGVIVRFAFDDVKLRNFHWSVRSKSSDDASRVDISIKKLYTWGLHAAVPLTRAVRRPHIAEQLTDKTPRSFYFQPFIIVILYKHANLESIGNCIQ